MKVLLKYTSLLILVLAMPAVFLAQGGLVRTKNEVRYQELEIGGGEEAQTGKVAVIHFTAWLDNGGVKGTQFYNTREHGEPVAFKIGTEKVMPGWNIGIEGMRVGGKRRLMIPAGLGYGTNGADEVVPPNVDLIFEVELVDVR